MELLMELISRNFKVLTHYPWKILTFAEKHTLKTFVMKRFLLFFLLGAPLILSAENLCVSSPDGNLKVTLSDNDGKLAYAVNYKEHSIIESSPLGLITNVGDYTKDAKLVAQEMNVIDEQYTLNRSKVSDVHYVANQLSAAYEFPGGRLMRVVFNVSNNDIAFKYILRPVGETTCAVVNAEATGFDFPEGTTTFLTPQSDPMVGWKRTKPSYEEEYVADEPMGTPSKYGRGYTFPGLFHIGNCWALVSETGVTGNYCGSRLSEGTADGLYTIAYPMEGENNGFGSTGAQIALTGSTPWRTITVGDNLKPIVETTIPFDVVKPLYDPSTDYKFGRSSWHWMIWDDASCNFEDVKKFIDLSAAMGWEYTLIDGLWDKQIGYEKVEELIQYAKDKGVEPFLWYNSNGAWNDAPQGPHHRMANPIARKKEMKWMQKMGVKGIKVDFWAGDKQETMRLYEQVLSDANDYGIMCDFHGCTLPRGWERMYPNYIGSEAVLASENLKFNQYWDDNEAFNASLHPFIRNAVGCMEFGGTILNKRLNRTNDGGTIRRTGDAFQLATAVLFQNPVQMFGLTPNNLEDAPAEAMDFMRAVPTTWDETRYIDGYPGKYVILARRHGSVWYVAAINNTGADLKTEVDLSFFGSSIAKLYADGKELAFSAKELQFKKNKKVKLTIPHNGGCVIVEGKEWSGNPILPGFHADPEVLYSEKTGRYYIYTTTDGQPGWGGWYYTCFSSDNLVDWRYEGINFDVRNQTSWASGNAWAPAIIEKKVNYEHKYFFYFSGDAGRRKGKAIGVAVADNPEGPFTDAIDKPLVDYLPEGQHHGQQIDVDVFTDPDTGISYLYWGNGYMAGAELNNDMVSIKEGTVTLMTPEGGTLQDYAFREAPYVFKRNGLYYFLWSVDDTGSPNYHVAYGTSTSPLGPIEVADEPVILIQRPEEEIYGPAHNSVLQIPGKDEWYIVYHRINKNFIDWSKGPGWHRETCIDKMEFYPDGRIKPIVPTHQGVQRIK